MYQKSTNYELLYELAMKGFKLPCWVCANELRHIAVVKTINAKEIICSSLGECYFLLFKDVSKELFIRECQSYALEWILPINAEFHNNSGELEYQIALIPFVVKRMVTWCPIVLDFTHNEMVFHYKGIDKVITQDYGDYPYFLQNEVYWFNHNQETALIEALEILEYIRS